MKPTCTTFKNEKGIDTHNSFRLVSDVNQSGNGPDSMLFSKRLREDFVSDIAG